MDRSLSGRGAAKTATCVRKEIANRRDGTINILSSSKVEEGC